MHVNSRTGKSKIHVAFILVCILVELMSTNSTSISITGFNMRSLNSSIPYLCKLTRNSDIVFIAEHRLYANELCKLNDIDQDFDVYAKASGDLNPANQNIKAGHCGIAILWRKEFSQYIKIVECNSDRICVLEVSEAYHGRSLYVIGVYMPHQTCTISSFQDEINVLSEVIARLQHKGEIVIIGDTNCHFGYEYGTRGWGKTTRNAKGLMKLVETCNLKVYDLDDDFCTGPNYSFHVEGVGTSYIDHCIVSKELMCSITECKVLDEDCLNMSDHLPIKLMINTYKVKRGDAYFKESIAWHKLSPQQITELYTNPLAELLSKLLCDMENNFAEAGSVREIIEKGYNDLVSAIHTSAKVLPRTIFKPHCKPYWNDSLTKLAALNKRAWRQWVVGGRPRGDNPLFLKYKECKDNFRYAQRRVIAKYEQDNLDQVTNCQEMNIHYFWYLVNKTKNKNTSKCPIKLMSGVTITSDDDIRDAWGEYFGNLYKVSEDKSFDEEHRKHVRESLLTMTIDSYCAEENLLVDIDESEIEKLISELADRKAPGHDKITNEHVKYGGAKMIEYVTKLFSVIIKYECIPRMFKKGIIVPIPKGNKDKTRQDNYRGITLMPVFAKLFEKWILSRVEVWSRTHNIIHPLQGAAQPNCSSMHATWLVREAIADNMERGKGVYVGLLDIKKAFDTVWQEGLFYKLYHNGLNGKTWRILRYMFHQFKCMVRYGNDNSAEFNADQGIHQGSPMSMFLFQIYVNELLHEINSKHSSVKCVGVKIGAIAFADDIAILANSIEGLQLLVNSAYQYSKKWRFVFNPSKCSIVAFGKESNVQIKIGAENVKSVKKDNHLGVVLTDKSECVEEAILEKIQQCKSIGYATQALGSHMTPVSPKTSSKIYWSVCMPKLCYGTEVIDVSENVIRNMEEFHCSMAKHSQSLPAHCNNPGSLATVGWKCIKAHCNFLKLIFLWQLLALSFDCVYKEICVKRLCLILYTEGRRRGPLCNIMEVCSEYGLHECVRYAIELGWYMSKHVWKTLVKNSVVKLENKRWLIRCKLYKSLSFLSDANYSMCAWWIHAYYDYSFSKQNRIIIRLLLNVHLYLAQVCPCCELNCVNNVVHILFVCPCISNERKALWEKVKESSPSGIVIQMANMTLECRTRFILNAFYSRYVHDWKPLYDSISNYICNVYTCYSNNKSGI